MSAFDSNCQACPRLVGFLKETKQKYPDYYAAPVPSFGDANPKVLIVGLAPGMHGANRTGRPFTGDASGELLYQTLYDLGLSNAAVSKHGDDSLQLQGVRITNAVKCLPPENKPNASEIKQCNSFLMEEFQSLPKDCRLFALGLIAHQAILRAYGLKLTALKFTHGATHHLPDGRLLVDSYHCSRYNTQTGRLTAEMFKEALSAAL